MLINAELARRDVFAGIRKPLILGEPPAWVAWYAEALALDAQGHAEQAWELRGKAWDASPGFSAAINDKQCEWISDADARLGPIFEAYLDGAYYWIPYTQLQRFESKAPEVLAEIVWLPIRLTLSTQAEIRGYSPVRYPGSENDPDSELRLARRTEWRDAPGGGSIALGQRLFDTDIGEFPLLECRSIDFSPNPGLPTPPSP
jgi:type VI secretion system protein ImpE